MLEQFKGELLHHPAALEYSGNVCSHNCAYCFANSRSEDRRYSVAALAKLCLGHSKSDSLAAWLFNQGHAVCISNRTDPFGASNADNTATVLQLMDLVPNGVYLQTKGCSDPRNWDVLDRFQKKNVVAYVTITAKRDEILKRLEPGAPRYAERIRFAKYCKSRGWSVVVGINPCWPAWVGESEIDEIADECRSFGVDEFFLEPLGMKRITYAALTANRKARMPESEISGAYDNGSRDMGYFVAAVLHLRKRGFKAYTQGLPFATEYGLEGYRLLGKVINPVYLFTNYMYAEHAATGRQVFTFKDFCSVLFKGNEEMLEYRHHDFYKYIMCIHRGVWKQGGLAKTAASLVDVYRVVWNNIHMYHTPQKLHCCCTIGAEGRPERDEYGNVLVGFLGEARIGCGRRQFQLAGDLGWEEVKKS